MLHGQLASKEKSPETVTPKILPDIDSFAVRILLTVFVHAELRQQDVRTLPVRQDQRVAEPASRASHYLVSPRVIKKIINCNKRGPPRPGVGNSLSLAGHIGNKTIYGGHYKCHMDLF